MRSSLVVARSSACVATSRAQLRARRMYQRLREQREQPGVRCDVVRVGAGDGRLDDRQLLRRERADLHEAAVGGQSGADERGLGAATLREFSSLLQGGVGVGIAGAMQCGSQANDELRTFCVGAPEGDAVLERDAKPRCGFAGCEVRKRVVTGDRQPNAWHRRGDLPVRSGGRAARPSFAAVRP